MSARDQSAALICVSELTCSPAGGHLLHFPFRCTNRAASGEGLCGEGLLEWSSGSRVPASSAFQAKWFLRMLVASSTSRSPSNAPHAGCSGAHSYRAQNVSHSFIGTPRDSATLGRVCSVFAAPQDSSSTRCLSSLAFYKKWMICLFLIDLPGGNIFGQLNVV